MKVCFKTADGLLCVDHVEGAVDETLFISRTILQKGEGHMRRYERTGERLAGVPVFEEVL